MRRAAFVLLGTAVGTSLLVGAKLGKSAPASVEDVAIAGGVAADGPQATPTAAAPTAAKKPTPGGTPTTAAARTTAAGGTTKTTAPNPPAAGLKSGTYTGAGITYEYGTVRVTVTVSGGVVTAASATYPTDKPTSKNINDDAVPKLNSWTVAAKTSANISTVSGATLTSNAYKKSLQSALDKAKA